MLSNLIINRVEQSPPFECTSRLANQEIVSFLCIPKVLHKSSPIPTIFIFGYFNIIIPFTSRTCERNFPSGFSQKICLCIYYISHVCYVSCPSHYFDLINPIIFFVEYKLWNSSLCIYLHYTLTIFLFGPNILLTILFSNTVKLTSCLFWERPNFNKQNRIILLCVSIFRVTEEREVIDVLIYF